MGRTVYTTRANFLDDIKVFGNVKALYEYAFSSLNTETPFLDPHSTYLDLDHFKDLQQGTSGEFGGLGIEVGMEDGFVRAYVDGEIHELEDITDLDKNKNHDIYVVVDLEEKGFWPHVQSGDDCQV